MKFYKRVVLCTAEVLASRYSDVMPQEALAMHFLTGTPHAQGRGKLHANERPVFFVCLRRTIKAGKQARCVSLQHFGEHEVICVFKPTFGII